MINIKYHLEYNRLIFHLDISGKDSNDEQFVNIDIIFVALFVFHLDISGKDNNKLHWKKI